MRHPYASLAVFGLAAVGVMSIVNKGKKLVKEKAGCVGNMLKGMKCD